LTTGKASVAMYFNDISPGRSESQLRFRLIHFWEARNIAKARAFLGLELLLIDEHGTVMQGFISSNRAETYRPHLKAGATYTLQIFFATRSKEIYRVADQSLTISFSNGSVLAPLDDDDIPVSVSFPADRFRFHTHDDFQANRGLRGDLYDVVGHLRLVNGQSLIDRPVLDEAEIISMRHVLWSRYEAVPLGQGCKRFLQEIHIQLTSNPEIANRVTRVETMTIGQIFAYIKQEYAKEASFDCIATIDDVERDSAWYYIACGGCQTKATRGPSSLMCAKCGNTNVSGVAKYLAKISVYDNNDQAVFILLGDAGTELTGKQAAELVDNYFEANQELGAGHQMPAPPPQALIDTIGQTHKFRVKVSNLNFSGKIQAITVTKVFSPEILPPVPTLTEIPLDAEDEVSLATASVVDGSGINADDGNESSSKRDESQKAKRPKHGN
ncbi:hypothetical protein HID58_093912, partial [Brassica napus]